MCMYLYETNGQTYNANTLHNKQHFSDFSQIHHTHKHKTKSDYENVFDVLFKFYD